jgi:hypothetical protein
MAIREGRWDCPSCGSKGIYGRHVDCPGCGKPRPADIRFYLTDDAPVIRDAAQLAEAKAGPNWICEHCGASTRATETDCDGCGAPRGSSPSQRVIDYPTAQVPRSGDEDDDAPKLPPAPVPLAAPVPRGRKGRVAKKPEGPREPLTPARTLRACGCLTAMVVGAIFLLFSLVRACNDRLPVGGEDLTAATVVGKRWERAFDVEQRRLVEGTGWDLPDSAEVVRSRRRLRGAGRVVDHYESVTRPVQRSRQVASGTRRATRQVPDSRTSTRRVTERVQTGERTYVCGQRDLGNGYFEDIECSEPIYENQTRTEEYEEPTTRTEEYDETVYRTEYYWENETTSVPVHRRVQVYDTFFTWRVAQWDSVETRHVRGDTWTPAWPDTTLRPDQRIVRRRDEYWMTFLRADGTRFGARVPQDVWMRWRVGQPVALREANEEDEEKNAKAKNRSAARRFDVLPADSLAACRRWHRGRDRDNPPGDSLGCSPPPPR